MYLVTVYLIIFSIFIVLIYLKKKWREKEELDVNTEPIIFIDMVDPDNAMLVINEAKKLASFRAKKLASFRAKKLASFRAKKLGAKKLGSDTINHLHIVLIGHPINFELSKYDTKSSEFNNNLENKVKMDFRNHVKEQSYEKNMWSKKDSETLLMANIHTLEQLLVNAGIDLTQVSFYLGGITPRSGLSHAIHDYEEQFMNEKGEILSKDKYDNIVTTIHNATPLERRKIREESCNSKSKNITKRVGTMKELANLHKKISTIKWYLAGPATGILSLLKESNTFMCKNGFIKAMAGAWEGKKNLLGGNFNEQVDFDAFKTIFCGPQGPLFKNATITFLTTETAKQDDWLCYDKEEIQDILGDNPNEFLKIAQLAELWASLKPGDSYPPAFDLALSYDDFNIPFNLYPINLSVVTDKNAFCGERSKLTRFNLHDYINYFFCRKNNVYAYGY